MPELQDYKDWYLESDDAQRTWHDHAELEWKFYNGDQWDSATKTSLLKQKRPVLTLNYIRRIIRLLVGYEMRSRYDMKCYPIGEVGDDEAARLATRIIRHMYAANSADFQYSMANKIGMITGRGWVKTTINYDENIFGNAALKYDDTWNIFLDPFGLELDLTDHKYQIAEKLLEQDKLIAMYPDSETEIKKMATDTEHPTNTDSTRTNYRLREYYYKEFKKENYLVNLQEGKVILLDTTDKKEEALQMEDDENFMVRSAIHPVMKWATLVGNEILEKGTSQHLAKYYPLASFFSEFLPRMGDIAADWVSIIRDAVDPQKEINKRRTMWTDILIRTVNKGWLYEEGTLRNPGDLDKMGTKMGVQVIVNPGMFDKIKEISMSQVSGELYQAGASSIEDLMEVMGINPAMLGYEQSSRESGKALMARRQQGNVMVAPFMDNFRITRLVSTRNLLSMIPYIYNPTRIARLVAKDGTINTMTDEDKVGMQKLLSTKDILHYDIEISETPQTPTQRIAEFVEMKEMIELGLQYGMPPTPGMLRALVMASDVSQKQVVLKELEAAAQQQAQLAEQEPTGQLQA